ncbi:hypothetical protein [Cyclobacterium plantarum]|uniref:Uncharacterized protein n=1 Tax=Cyclobacterium plantarum TaxID=2716263 RepID=A0ABX0H457_9BACT|nr:hypothetical protein [Cyclobacterium plantarum]NHE56608.1 hypothetical protein [Cyclobacterium plantarum]
MKFKITINELKTVEELPNYWNNQDYIYLLEQFDFPDAKTIKPENLLEMLHMAITDFEPNEAAAIVLTYKLSDRLNEGQIAQISNDMLQDKVSEEYPEIDLHYDLFNINQLLYKAFNGKFPNAKATIVGFSMVPDEDKDKEVTKEMVLKSFNNGISDRNLIKRLFTQQLSTEKEFAEAEAVLWKLDEKDPNHFTLITSEYWLSKEDFVAPEFEGLCLLPEEDENEGN